MAAYNPEDRPTIEEIKQGKADIVNANEEEIDILRTKIINEIENPNSKFSSHLRKD